MTTRATHAESEAAPITTPPQALAGAPGPAGVELLQRTIGNRAVGSLLRRRVLARDLKGKPQEGQLVTSDKGIVYEIMRSDFDEALKEWTHKVKGADGKAMTIQGGASGYRFSSATQLIEAAIADKATIESVVEGLPETHVNKLADFHAWLDKIEPQLSAAQFAYLAAAIMINSSHAPAARQEARRLISAQVGDKTVAMRMIKKPVMAVIVPRDKQMTELPEFQTLKTSDTGGGPGKTFDGRLWAHVRGVGNVRVGTKVYAAITEENLLGGSPDPKVYAEKKDDTGAVVTAAGTPSSGYTVGYSTTTHEFAHVLHRNGLSDDDKKVITTAYQARRAETTGSEAKLSKDWVDGPRVGPSAPKSWQDKGWTDAKWMKHLAGLTDDARKKFECYAAQNESEYFAQLSNAYIGTNLGTDATTRMPRKNGRAWIEANEPKEMLALLDRLYQNKTVSDVAADGKLVSGGKCANPPQPPPGPPGPPPSGTK